jgi:hypothetical protein
LDLRVLADAKLHLSLRHAFATMIGLINCLQQYDAAVALQCIRGSVPQRQRSVCARLSVR